MAINHTALAIVFAFNAFAMGMSGEHKTIYRPTGSRDNISVYELVDHIDGIQTLFPTRSHVTGPPVFKTVPAWALGWTVSSLEAVPSDFCGEAGNATTAPHCHSDHDRVLRNRTDFTHASKLLHSALGYSETGNTTTAAHSHSDQDRVL